MENQLFQKQKQQFYEMHIIFCEKLWRARAKHTKQTIFGISTKISKTQVLDFIQQIWTANGTVLCIIKIG